MAAWVDERFDRARRPSSHRDWHEAPHHPGAMPSSERPYNRDSYDYHSDAPPRRRMSEGAGAHGAGYYSRPEGDVATASTYRPRYDRQPSELATHQEHPIGRPPERQAPARQPANNVWMSETYRKQRTAAHSNTNGAQNASQLDKKPASKPMTISISKVTADHLSGSTTPNTTAPAPSNAPQDTSAMEIDSSGSNPDTDQRTREVEANPEADRNMPNVTRSKSTPVPLTSGEQTEDLQTSHTHNGPTPWLRTKSMVTTSPVGLTAPSSPPHIAEKPGSVQERSNVKIEDMLQKFFSATVESHETRQELRIAQKLFDGNMKDLNLSYSKEDAITRAKASSHMVALRKKQEFLEEAVSKCDKKGKVLARELSEAIQNGSQQLDTTTPSDLRNELTKLQSDNDRLIEKNLKLESRLLTLEVSLRDREADAKSLSDAKTAVEKVNSDVASLLTTKDITDTRIADCESKIELIKSQAITAADVDVKKLEAAYDTYDASFRDIKARLDQFADLRKDLETLASEQRDALMNARQEALGEFESFTTTNTTMLESSIATTKDYLEGLEEKITSISQHPDIDAMSASIAAVSEKIAALENISQHPDIDSMSTNIAAVSEKIAALENISQHPDIDSMSTNIAAVSEKIAALENNMINEKKDSIETLSRLNANIKSLKATVAEQSSKLSKLSQSSFASPLASPSMSRPQPSPPSIPGRSAPTPPAQPVVPSQPVVSSSVHNANPQMTMVATSQHLPGQGVTQVSGPQVMPNLVWSSHTNPAQWRYGPISSPLAEQAPNLREIMNRLVALEQFVAGHEQRLNFTTIEACWNPMVRHIMNYIEKNYRYPESVSKTLTGLQNTTGGHAHMLADLSRRVTDLDAQRQHGPDSGALRDKVAENSTAIERLKAWTNTDFKALTSGIMDHEIKRGAEFRKDAHDRIQQAIDEFDKTTAEAKVQLARLQKHASDPDQTSPSELYAQVTKLYTESQDLQSFCVEEVSKLHGRVAELKEQVQGRPADGGERGGGVGGGANSNRATTYGEDRKRAAVADVRRAYTPASGRNETTTTGGSSSESVRGSSRKRRRKLTD